jgi:integrase
MGRYQLCGRDDERDTFDRLWRRRPVQDRILAATSAPSPAHRRNSSELESRASPPQAGRLGLRKWAPPWPQAVLGQAILRKYIGPLAQELGIEKRIGWHTFRHTYSTLLRSVGTEFKVMQELLRHSSLRSTLDVYTQAITPAKHAAQAAVMSLVFSPKANPETWAGRLETGALRA